jgi:hypothetical protein
VLEFSAGGAPFGETLAPGTGFEADAVFWPSAAPLRALLRDRKATRAWGERLPGTDVAGLLAAHARRIAALPWVDRVGVTLADVAIVRDGAALYVRDARGDALPLSEGDHLRMLAISGGHPVGVAGEWNGRTLRPLSVIAFGAAAATAAKRGAS